MVGRLLFIFAFAWSGLAKADDISVAVSSGFMPAVPALADAFGTETGHRLIVTEGSSGALIERLDDGATFDVMIIEGQGFLEKLGEYGRILDMRTVAEGQLVLISNAPMTEDTAAEAFVGKRVALADPTASAYGLAATRVMERLVLDTARFTPLVVGSTGQVAAVFANGEADMAFVARSYLDQLDTAQELGLNEAGTPILLGAAILSDGPAVQQFTTWLGTDAAAALIAGFGFAAK